MDFERLYNAYFMRVYSYIMTLVKNRGEAEEITQRTFFKAFTAKKSYAGDSSPYTYLCSIAKNLFLDGEKEKKRRADLTEVSAADFPFPPGADSPETKAEEKEDTLRIHMLLHQMEEPYKEVFQLRVFGELGFSDIGKLFGKSENWARVTYHRAKNKIKEGMEQA